MLEAQDQIRRFQDFFEEVYKTKVVESVSKGKNFVVLDFSDLIKYDPELAEDFLNNPEETLKAAEISIEQLDIIEGRIFRIRLSNLPSNTHMLIRNIRSSHLGKLHTFEGIVRQKSDVRPQVVASKFECPACGQVISVLQVDTNFREPTKCGCGRKGRFNLLSKDMVDAQGIVLEESSEMLEGGAQPKRINIFLKEDLVSPISEKRTNPGSKIKVVGLVKEIPFVLKSGGKSTRFDLLIEANNVEAVEESFYDIEVSQTEVDKIKELSKDPNIYDKMINSLAPSIYGYAKTKEALILQLMGGVQKKRTDGMVSRGDIHVLLVGDPGSGKSQLLKRISQIAPKGRYVSGKGVSGAGLTAAVVKDEFLGGWSLEAGALVLANNGICCIDEMDKMSNEDRAAMHEALEQQSISIAKANIQATLLARTTVLAAANPHFGRFDPYGIIAEQINLPPTLINRFDLIFPIKDLPDEGRDERMAKHILNLHQTPDVGESEIDTNLLKKYVVYARQNIFPKLTNVALNEIKDFYVKMRNMGSADEKAVRAVPISARQLEALVRLAEASARVRLDDKVKREDAQRAIKLLTYCLLQIGIDKETGEIDIDRITTGITASQRNKIVLIKDLILDLSKKFENKLIPVDEVMQVATSKGMKESEVEHILHQLNKNGEIYEPRHGFIQKL